MKTLLSILFLSFIQLVSAQQPFKVTQNKIDSHAKPAMLPDPTAQDSDDTVFKVADIKPEFPGGQEKFYKFVSTNFVIPEDAEESVKVFVSFIVEKDGSLSDIKILRDTGYGTGKEAIRVLKGCPKWKPAIKDGKPVRFLYSFPINIVNRKEAK